jgi:hypothetical protein
MPDSSSSRVEVDGFGAHDGTTVPPKVLSSGERRASAAEGRRAMHKVYVMYIYTRGRGVSLGAFLIDFGGYRESRARRAISFRWLTLCGATTQCCVCC